MLIIASIIVETLSQLEFDADVLNSDSALLSLFQSWSLHHGKQYTMKEFEARLQVFKDNLGFIHAHNGMKSGYKLGLNEFADLTHDEFKEKFFGLKLSLKKPSNKKRVFKHENTVVRGSVDWRLEGAVTDVKNQGQCGGSMFTLCYVKLFGLYLSFDLVLQEAVGPFRRQEP